MLFRVLKIFVTLTLITSCAPVVGSNTWFKTASDIEIKSYLGEQCEKYGFKKGTNALVQCIQREANAQKDRAETLESSNGLRFGLTLRTRL